MIQDNTIIDKIDYYAFREWASNNLNVYQMLRVFEVVPSPLSERKIILEILHRYDKKHGDTMYAVSYRWWDMWKMYTSEHQSTRDEVEYVQQIKSHILANDDAPQFLKDFLFAYYEEQRDEDF